MLNDYDHGNKKLYDSLIVYQGPSDSDKTNFNLCRAFNILQIVSWKIFKLYPFGKKPERSKHS